MTKTKNNTKENDALFKWVKKRVKLLQQYTDELSEIDSTIFYDVKPWTPLKLIVLGYFTSVYTKIISNQSWCNNMVYIDLFANSGINKVNKKDFLLGSPFVAICAAKNNPFNKMFFVEIDQNNVSALENRLRHLSTTEGFEWINPAKQIFCGDCNDSLRDIVEQTNKKGTHCLSFVDPEGMEIPWSNFELLLTDIRSDIIFTFMTGGIQRLWGRAKNGNTADEQRFNTFYGGEEWKNAKNSNDLLEIYKNKIEACDKIVKSIKIQGTNFYYHLLFITKPTQGGNKWLDAIDRVKTSVESSTEVWVKEVLDQLSGRQQTLFG